MLKNNLKLARLITGIICVIAATMAVLVYFMHGSTSIKSTSPEPIHNTTLICTSDQNDYPFFTFDRSLEKKTTVAMVFENEKISSVSLKYIMHYDDNQTATKSSDENRVAMHKSFGQSGLAPDALNISYLVQSDDFITTLYTEKNNLNTNAEKYFLINDVPLTAESAQYERSFKNKNFDCTKD